MKDTSDHSESIQTIVAKATTDADFRRQLLADPLRAIEELLGARLEIAVRFVEHDPRYDVTVVLPVLVEIEAELTLEELDTVAGGTNWCDPSCDTQSQ